MATARKFPIRTARIPVFEGDRLVGFATAVALELEPEPETGRLTLHVSRIELEPAVAAEQLALDNPSADAEPDGVALVWEEFVTTLSPRSKSLDPQARTIIRDALKVASVEECRRAIRGNKASRFHQGENDRRKKYNRLSHILKGRGGVSPRTTRETIDFFIDVLKKEGGFSVTGVGVAGLDHARLRSAKQEVRDGLEFPGDEHVVERAEKAEQWLAANGYQVVLEGSTVSFNAPPVD